MKIASNQVQSVVRFFHSELKDRFEKGEIETMLFYCFSKFLGFTRRVELIQRATETMSESVLLKFNFAVKELKKNKPLQYILGETVFYGLHFKMNTNVLIPRPETEELVDMIIRENTGRSFRILDIGTGSGCIAVSICKNLPGSEVYGLDISSEALLVAKENALTNGTSVKFLCADILKSPPDVSEGSWDIIVSNPPYVTDSEKAEMIANVLEFEPHLALFVPDSDPLLFYRAIVRYASENLNNDGLVYFEINREKGTEVKELLVQSGFSEVRVKKDMQGNDRMVSARRFTPAPLSS
jgi:release factor glutamine methyltransferase